MEAAVLPELHGAYLPQLDGGLVADFLAGGADLSAAIREVHKNDIRAMKKCKILVAVLDGPHVDSGVAFEIGYFYALGKPIIGFHTDSRTEFPFGHNPMIGGAMELIVNCEKDLLQALDSYWQK